MCVCVCGSRSEVRANERASERASSSRGRRQDKAGRGLAIRPQRVVLTGRRDGKFGPKQVAGRGCLLKGQRCRDACKGVGAQRRRTRNNQLMLLGAGLSAGDRAAAAAIAATATAAVAGSLGGDRGAGGYGNKKDVRGRCVGSGFFSTYLPRRLLWGIDRLVGPSAARMPGLSGRPSGRRSARLSARVRGAVSRGAGLFSQAPRASVRSTQGIGVLLISRRAPG